MFGTAEAARLVAVPQGTVVAFEVDELDPVTCLGWAVTVVGEARILDEPEAAVYRTRLAGLSVDGTHDGVVVVEVTLTSGHQIGS